MAVLGRVIDPPFFRGGYFGSRRFEMISRIISELPAAIVQSR